MTGRLVVTLALAVAAAAPAQTPPAPPLPPCSTAQARQLDFWVGTWDLTGRSRAQPGSDQWRTTRSTNVVTRELGGCAIVEHFQNIEPAPWGGMSISSFNASTGRWHQTWTDSQGGWIPLSGSFADGRMVLQTEPRALPSGGTVVNRMVYHGITRDTFTWDWETSRDEGRTWETMWSITYRRRA